MLNFNLINFLIIYQFLLTKCKYILREKNTRIYLNDFFLWIYFSVYQLFVGYLILNLDLFVKVWLGLFV